MDLSGKTVVVTGAGSGIGRALCEAFHQAGAKKIVVADIDLQAAEAVAGRIGGAAILCDVAKEAQVRSLIEKTEVGFGPIDLYCSNAGVALGFSTQVENAAAGPEELWERSWSINVMGHVYAARHLTADEDARRRVSAQHGLCCGSSHSNRKRNLFDNQTRCGRLCRKYRDCSPG